MVDHAKSALLCLGLLFAAACGRQGEPPSPAPPGPALPATGARLVFGDIDANDPARKFEWIKPFADHVASRLGELGIGTGDVRIAPDIATMISWLAAAEVDVYLDSLYPAMVVCERSGARPILRRWKGGASEYHTVFLATVASGIRSLEQLPGRMLAFDDEASTSGYFLPATYLHRRGYALERYPTHAVVPPADRIGYVFTGDDENSIQWLLSGRVAGVAIDSLTFQNHLAPETRDRLVLLARTEPVPRQVVVVRSGVEPGLRQALVDVLSTLHETPAGRQALASIDTARFDSFPEGAEAALESFGVAYSAVRDRIEP